MLFPPPGMPGGVRSSDCRGAWRPARSLTTRTGCGAGQHRRRTHIKAGAGFARRPAPSRVCPRTSTGRFGVHVRSGGRLSRAATHLRLAQAGRVACGHSRDGFLQASLAQWSQSAGLRSRRTNVRIVHEAPPQRPAGLPVRSSAVQAEEAGSTPARGTTADLKPLGELTPREAQTGRNDWAASEPVTDNLFDEPCVAQVGARLLWEQRVAGSSPAARTSHVVAIAQLEERRSVEPEVAGSRPAGDARCFKSRAFGCGRRLAAQGSRS